MIDIDKRKQLAQDTLNELRSRRVALDEKVEGWLAAAGGFFTASSVTSAFSEYPVISSFIGIVLIAAGWLRIIYFRTKIIWIEDAALTLNQVLNDKEVAVTEWNRVLEEKDGCARKNSLWEGVTACPYTAMIMAGLLLAQATIFMYALPYSIQIVYSPKHASTCTARSNNDIPLDNQLSSKVDATKSGQAKSDLP